MQTPYRLSMIVLALTVVWAAPTVGQSAGDGTAAPQAQNANAPVFSAQEIDAMVAPIALYPDALLSQVLMAATYPLEIVQAARWSKSSGNTGGEAALSKVSDQTWDPSVQSLVAFPQVLTMMSDQLDWTQKLGDAFLAQQGDVMDSIQRLRQQAQKAGNLTSNTQQNVSTQGQTIIIEPAQPNVVYVPAYNPTVVYGAWAYPSYPPVYYPGVMSWYPGQAVVNGLMWGAGVAAAGAIFGGFNWNNRDVNINVNNFNRINRNNFYSGQGNSSWKHNPQHRGAVAYRDNGSRQRYSTRDASAVNARNDLRGHGPAQGAGRPGDRTPARDGAGLGGGAGQARPAAAPQRDALQNRPAAPQRDALQNRPAAPQRDALQNRAAQAQPAARADAFRGVDAGRQSIDRGRASAAAASRPNVGHGGGGGRPGGGGGGVRGHGRG
ncbi:DUF3300 domain-containing protein [Zwartia vadi]|uniref:DUF3300 domain-containing protein n=1 Tax=Zwartia vadi TaxID=3058168 RepID=UPI0025B37555|nr:DUF3300 domain-containing protein [Zwartia vadi]MDN3986144.1 DUF3300 domain-containing protein [Zwartia vadi]